MRQPQFKHRDSLSCFFLSGILFVAFLAFSMFSSENVEALVDESMIEIQTVIVCDTYSGCLVGLTQVYPTVYRIWFFRDKA